ncbi:LIM-domain binding protein [Scleroderma citrinum]
MRPPVGFGQGCICLLQFSDQLSNENPSKHQLSFWNSWVKESFTPEASVKFTLWMDKKKVEARPIQISVFHLPRFFLVTAQCGVKSMTLSFDGAQETLYPHSHAVVKCDRAVWTYKYTNGYVVTLSGPLTVHVVLCPRTNQTPTPLQRFPWSLKFDHFQFESVMHAKFYSTSNPNGGPSQRWAEEENQGEPQTLIPDVSTAADLVNSFGIPVATMRCLQVSHRHRTHANTF